MTNVTNSFPVLSTLSILAHLHGDMNNTCTDRVYKYSVRVLNVKFYAFLKVKMCILRPCNI